VTPSITGQVLIERKVTRSFFQKSAALPPVPPPPFDIGCPTAPLSRTAPPPFGGAEGQAPIFSLLDDIVRSFPPMALANMSFFRALACLIFTLGRHGSILMRSTILPRLRSRMVAPAAGIIGRPFGRSERRRPGLQWRLFDALHREIVTCSSLSRETRPPLLVKRPPIEAAHDKEKSRSNLGRCRSRTAWPKDIE